MKISNHLGLVGWICAALLVVCVSYCTGQQPAQSAAEVAAVRQTVCVYVEANASASTEMAHLATLCRAGADLKPIAAAYAGCVAPAPAPAPALPTADSGTPSDAGIVDPWTDAAPR